MPGSGVRVSPQLLWKSVPANASRQQHPRPLQRHADGLRMQVMNIGQISHLARRLTLAAVVVGSVALVPTAQGQDPQQQGSPDGARMDPRQMIDQKMARLTETLKLDSAQQIKVRSILADETMEMEDLRKNSGGQHAGGGGGERGGGMRGGRGGGRRGGAPPDSTGGAEGRGGSE